MTAYDADVIVVGLGAIGAMALWRLAKRGADVIGIEQFGIPHHLGSSGGSTRLFRTACFEHPQLGLFARHAHSLWRELECNSGSEILTLTGGVMIGPADSNLLAGTNAAAEVSGVRLTSLTHQDLAERFPAHISVDPSYVGLWDPHAGVVRPEVGITAAIATASSSGARALTGTRVVRIDESCFGVQVTTDSQSLRARSVVVATGPWLADTAKTPPLRPMRVIMTWFNPAPEPLPVDVFPVFIRHVDASRTFWGHGQIDGLPVKIGAPIDPSNFRATHPDTIDRTVHAEDVHLSRNTVARFLSGIDPQPASSSVCMVTLSADGQFVLGPRDRGSAVILAGGCSGHAFKHAPAIGDYVAAMALGREPPVAGEFMDPIRFLSARS